MTRRCCFRHFANGVWGTIAAGLFSTGSNTAHAGLFYGGGLAQLGTSCWVWSAWMPTL